LKFAYPFAIDKNGRAATASYDDHIEQMVEQVLFTAMGERVNRPTFGSGISQLVFAPLSSDLVAATQMLVTGSLQQWLADLIVVQAVGVIAQESTVQITVRYAIRQTQEQKTATFTQEF
jgi:Bacteriophage baseplate protein W